MTQGNPTQQQISIELPVDLEAAYSNLAIINHSPSEIVIDFARVLPNVPKARIYSRVVMTPLNARLFMMALQDNLAGYEEKYGAINLPSEATLQGPPDLFNGRRPNE
jgi:hypothetical protein